MKWWNKSKKYRDAQWHVVNLPSPNGQRWRQPEIKKWCQMQPGGGRFYWSSYKNIWYFEKGYDAILFDLRWI